MAWQCSRNAVISKATSMYCSVRLVARVASEGFNSFGTPCACTCTTPCEQRKRQQGDRFVHHLRLKFYTPHPMSISRFPPKISSRPRQHFIRCHKTYIKWCASQLVGSILSSSLSLRDVFYEPFVSSFAHYRAGGLCQRRCVNGWKGYCHVEANLTFRNHCLWHKLLTERC